MRYSSTFFLSLFLTFTTYAQIVYQKGYIIDNQDIKTECFIRNIDWKKNPQSFKYRFTENGEVVTGTLENVKEFGVENASRFIKINTDIDISSDLQQKLSYEKQPILENRTFFLRVLITGEANLYVFEDKEFIRFFYSKRNKAITQLIYKRYLQEGSGTGTSINVSYKQQLMNDLITDKLSKIDFETLTYTKESLERLFISYNQAFNTPQTVVQSKVKRKVLAVSLTPGLSYSNLSIINDFTSIKYSSQLEYRLGCQIEAILPFNMNKWSLYIEPTFHLSPKRKFESSTISYPDIKFKFITLPIGFKGKSFLKNGGNIFYHTNFDFGVNTSFNSKFANIEISPASNFAVGVGYGKNKLSFECRYISNTNLFKKYQFYYSDYDRIQLVLGYRLIYK